MGPFIGLSPKMKVKLLDIRTLKKFIAVKIISGDTLYSRFALRKVTL